MSERLNIAFCDDSTGAPYALLALKDITLCTPSIARWLTALAEVINEHAMSDAPRISALAAAIIASLGSDPGTGSDLLPGDSQWLADLTVNLRCVGDQLLVACKKRDLSALGVLSDDDELEPLDALDGFERGAVEFHALIAGIQWDSLE